MKAVYLNFYSRGSAPRVEIATMKWDMATKACPATDLPCHTDKELEDVARRAINLANEHLPHCSRTLRCDTKNSPNPTLIRIAQKLQDRIHAIDPQISVWFWERHIPEASTPATAPDDQPLYGKGISLMTLRNMSKLTTTDLAEEAHRAAVALDGSGDKVEGDLALIVAEMARRLVDLETRVRSTGEPDS